MNKNLPDDWHDFILANQNDLEWGSIISNRIPWIRFTEHSITKEQRNQAQKLMILGWYENGLYGVPMNKRTK